MNQNGTIKSMLKKRILGIFAICVVLVASILCVAFKSEVGNAKAILPAVVTGGWKSELNGVSNADKSITYDFGEAKVQGGWSSKKIINAVPFEVGKPFTIKTKMHWVYNTAGYPTPSCYTFSFKDTMQKVVSEYHNFQVFNQYFGIYELGGVAQNSFVDRNQFKVPEFNEFVITVNQDNTTIIINNSETKAFNTIKAQNFPDGQIYFGIGMLFDAAVDISEYKFDVMPIDSIVVNTVPNCTIVEKKKSPVSFGIDARGESKISAKLDNKLIDANNYTFIDNIITFNADFCAKLPVGDNNITLSNGKGDVVVKIIVMTAPVSVGDWKVSVTADSYVNSGEDVLAINNVKSFVATSILSYDIQNGYEFDFSAKNTEINNFDKLTFEFFTETESLVVTIDLKKCMATISGKYMNSNNLQELFVHNNNFLYFRLLEQNKLKLVKNSENLELFIDNFRSVPLWEVNQIDLLNAKIKISAEYNDYGKFALKSITQGYTFTPKSVGGWSSLHDDQITTNIDDSMSVTLNDANFDNIMQGDNAFSRDRIYSSEGYDVNKPLVLYVFADWEASASGWWGLNLSANKYDFNLASKNAYKYDFLFGGAYSGERLEYVKTGDKLLFNDNNNPMVSYTDRTQMNKICIEVGETSTKITLNDVASKSFPIRKSKFVDGKIYVNFGGYLNNQNKKVRFTIDTINKIDVGTTIYQNYIQGSNKDISYYIDNADDFTLFINSTQLQDNQFVYDKPSNKLTIKAVALESILQDCNDGRYTVVVTNKNNISAKLYFNYYKIAEDNSSEHNLADKAETEKNDKSGCAKNSSKMLVILMPLCLLIALKRKY